MNGQPFGSDGRKRGPGRPRLSPDHRSSVSAWIPTSHLDALVTLSNTERVSVSQFVGRLVAREVVKFPTNK